MPLGSASAAATAPAACTPPASRRRPSTTAAQMHATFVGAAAPAVTFVKVMTSVLSSVHAPSIPLLPRVSVGSNRRMARSEAASTVAPSAAPARSVATSKATVRVSPLPKIASRLSASAAEAVSSSGGVRPKSPVTSWAAASPAAEHASLEPSGSVIPLSGRQRTPRPSGIDARYAGTSISVILYTWPLSDQLPAHVPIEIGEHAGVHTTNSKSSSPAFAGADVALLKVITTTSPALGRSAASSPSSSSSATAVAIFGPCLRAPKVPVAPTIAHAYDASQRRARRGRRRRVGLAEEDRILRAADRVVGAGRQPL